METKKWKYHKRFSMASQNYDFCKFPPRLFLTLNIMQFNYPRTPLLDAVIIISIFFILLSCSLLVPDPVQGLGLLWVIMVFIRSRELFRGCSVILVGRS